MSDNHPAKGEHIPFVVISSEPEFVHEEDISLPVYSESAHPDIKTIAQESGGIIVRHKERFGAYVQNEFGGATIAFDDGSFGRVGPQEAPPTLASENTKPSALGMIGVGAAVGLLIGAGAAYFGGSERQPKASSLPEPDRTEFSAEPLLDEDVTDEGELVGVRVPAFSPESGRVPVWDDGEPDVAWPDDTDTFHTFTTTPYNYDSHLGIDCTVAGTQEVEANDTIVGIGRENYEHDAWLGLPMLDFANTQLNIERGVIDSETDFIQPGDDVHFVGECVVSNYFFNEGSDVPPVVRQQSISGEWRNQVRWSDEDGDGRIEITYQP